MKNYLANYDPFFDLFFPTKGEESYHNLMKTDIVEKEDHYELRVNVPGIDKENVKISLREGYLNVEASISNEVEKNEKYLYRERSEGRFSRSYYVGEDVTYEDIVATMDKGVLFIQVKKVTPKKAEPKYISIN